VAVWGLWYCAVLQLFSRYATILAPGSFENQLASKILPVEPLVIFLNDILIAPASVFFIFIQNNIEMEKKLQFF